MGVASPVKHSSTRHGRNTHLFVVSLVLVAALPAWARENSLNAGLSLLEGYDSNLESTPTDHIYQWTTTVSPTFSFLTRSQTDQLGLTFTPSLRFVNSETNRPGVEEASGFDKRTEEYQLQLDAQKTFAKDYQILLNESYYKGDDPYVQNVPLWDKDRNIYISETIQRRRYYTNNVSLGTKYAYGRGSSLSLAYSNSIYDNYELRGGYKRDNVYFASEHFFDNQWKSHFSYSFTYGDFEDEVKTPAIPDSVDIVDITTNEATAGLDYVLSPHSTILTSYGYLNQHFERAFTDYQVHTATLGLRQELGPGSTLVLSLGPSYVQAESGTTTLTYSGEWRNKLRAAQCNVGFEGGYDQRYYDATGYGFTKYWLTKASLDMPLSSSSTTSLFTIFRRDRSADVDQGNLREDEWQAGTTLTYQLTQYAGLSLRYVYLKLNTNRDINNTGQDDSYDDHRLFLELKASSQLWRSL